VALDKEWSNESMTAKTSCSCGVSLSVAEAAGLKSRIQKALQKSSTIELNASEVQKADTAGLQLVLALIREVANADGRVVWKNPSKALIDAANLLGLGKELGLS
jgi:ABC-type transporter Mla MlaB component